LAVAFVLMLIYSRKAPVIASLDPPMAAPGQQVTVTGDYFGRTSREGSLSLAGEIPPPSLILSWTDQKIVFLVPEDAGSGLVTVANSQGISRGVLFTNTQTIPTVLRLASPSGQPLLLSVVPAQPQAGQSVTLSGRGFGTGDGASSVRVSTGASGPLLKIPPADTLVWTDGEISFRWPAGAGAGSSVRVEGPKGPSPDLEVDGAGPLSFGTPRTVVLAFRAELKQPADRPVTLWGPVPQAASGTDWSLGEASPVPQPGSLPPAFRWAAGPAASRTLSYSMTLTTWAKLWAGPPSGSVAAGDPPASDPGPLAFWKPSAPALKALTAKWGLDAPDPWLRALRIQTNLAAAFRIGPASAAATPRTPALILASGHLDGAETSSLAVALVAGAGGTARQVSGLWIDDNGRPQARTWAELWIAGAGWVPWDPAEGPPGPLDNRHFAFEVHRTPSARWEPRSELFGPGVPGTLGWAAGEVGGSGDEPVVRWEITLSGK